MIIGILHKGSGLGDQLFSYIATRVRAADLGVDFGFVGKEFFKGVSFMNLDWGKEPEGQEYLKYHIEEPSGALVLDDPMVTKHAIFVINKHYYDPTFNFITDGSVIDGYGAQDIRYFEHRLDEVAKWINIRANFADYPDDVCVLNIRGGEYRSVPELFLPKEYWLTAMEQIKDMKFEIHTDDLELAHSWFPEIPAYKDIELNYRAVKNARAVILSNSAFGILPALLNKRADVILAPKFWAGRNVGEWRRPGNYYKKFTYI